MSKRQNMGLVEVVMMSFGQSFRITPFLLDSTENVFMDGGKRIAPHLGMEIQNEDSTLQRKFFIQKRAYLLRKRIEDHTQSAAGSRRGRKGQQSIHKKLRDSGKDRDVSGSSERDRYIAAFLDFAPAKVHRFATLSSSGMRKACMRGPITVPVLKEIFDNILPYLRIKKT